MTQPSLSGELLSSEDIYKVEVERLPNKLTREQEHDLIERARQGDMQARQEMILSCQRYVRYVATKYAYVYSWASPRIEFLDLVQRANLAGLEALDMALAKEKPYGVLKSVMSWEIVHYCQAFASLIISPKDGKSRYAPAMSVESLDIPLHNTTQETFGDVLPSPEQEDEQDYTFLYEALKVLPDVQREVIERHYGLVGRGTPESLNSIGRQMRNVSKKTCPYAGEQEEKAIPTLRRVLEPLYKVA